MKKNGVPWQEVPDSNCEPAKYHLANAPRPQSESPSKPGVVWSKLGATSDGGTRQRVGPTAWLAFSVIS